MPGGYYADIKNYSNDIIKQTWTLATVSPCMNMINNRLVLKIKHGLYP